MGMTERLKAQDRRHAALDARVAALESELNELLAALQHEQQEPEDEPVYIETLDGVTYQSRERDQGETL